MKIVYATSTSIVSMPGGGTRHVRAGSHWPADDPIVLAQPSLFSTDPQHGLNFSGTRPPVDGDVEQATAAPGEKRGNRRD